MKPGVTSESTDEHATGAYMTRAGVARLLGVSPNTVTRWAREGKLPFQLTLGGHHRFERSVIDNMRAELRRAVRTDRAAAKPTGRGER
jgi:excisionase family DNA binding protein